MVGGWKFLCFVVEFVVDVIVVVADVVVVVVVRFESFDFVDIIDVTSDEQFDSESEFAIVVKIEFSGRKNHDATDAHCKIYIIFFIIIIRCIFYWGASNK